MERDERADDGPERELDRLEHESERLEEDIQQTRSDWEARKSDSAAPGAVGREASGIDVVGEDDPEDADGDAA